MCEINKKQPKTGAPPSAVDFVIYKNYYFSSIFFIFCRFIVQTLLALNYLTNRCFFLYLAQNHMNNDLAHLRKEFTSFDYFPLPLKEILMDIQYNVKGGISEKKWPKLYRAIREKNVFGKDGIIENVNRPDVGKERNDWTKRMAHLIRF